MPPVDPVDRIRQDDYIQFSQGTFFLYKGSGQFLRQLAVLLRDAALPRVPEKKIDIYELVSAVDHGYDLVEDLLIDDPPAFLRIPCRIVDEKTDILSGDTHGTGGEIGARRQLR